MFRQVPRFWQVITEVKHQGLGGRKPAVPRALYTWVVFIAFIKVAAPTDKPASWRPLCWVQMFIIGIFKALNTFEALCTRQSHKQRCHQSTVLKSWPLYEEGRNQTIRQRGPSYVTGISNPPWVAQPSHNGISPLVLLLLLYMQNVKFRTMRLICVFT